MRTKPPLYVSLPPREGPGAQLYVSASTVGHGDTKRIFTHAVVHSGPKDAIGRPVRFIHTPAEAVAVAVALLGRLTPDELAAAPEADRKRLADFLRMIRAAEETPKPS